MKPHTNLPESDFAGNTITMSKQGYMDLIKSVDGKNVYWTTDVNVELPIKMQSTGLGSTIKPETWPNAFRKTAAARKDAPAMRVQRNKKEQVWTWNQFY